MAFLVLFLSGMAGGILGGMGMGGGTALIPLLTLVCGVPQPVAQGLNLASFLPMSVMALSVHAAGGLLERRGLVPLIASALAFSVLFSLLAAVLPAAALRKGFGLFLVILSFFQLPGAFKEMKKSNKNRRLTGER